MANSYHISQLHGRWFKLSAQLDALKLPKAPFATLLFLLKCADRRRKAFPSIRMISDALRAARSTIIRALHDLIARGLLKKAPKRPGKHNLYLISASCPNTIQAQKKADAVCQPHRPPVGENNSSKSFRTIIVEHANTIVKRLHQAFTFLSHQVVSKSKSSI